MLLKPGSGGKELGVGGEFLSLISFTQNNKIKTKRSTSNLDKTPGVLWMTIVSLATKKKKKGKPLQTGLGIPIYRGNKPTYSHLLTIQKNLQRNFSS